MAMSWMSQSIIRSGKGKIIEAVKKMAILGAMLKKMYRRYTEDFWGQ